MKCARIGGWEGDCKNETLFGNRFCERDKWFEGTICRYSDCEESVTNYCTSAGSLVCGAPLCTKHSGWCPRCKG